MRIRGKILDRLSRDDLRVFDLERVHEGAFRITEGCDEYFYGLMSPDDLRALGQELIDAANSREGG